MKRKPPAMRSIGIDLNRRAIDGFSCGHSVELVHGPPHGLRQPEARAGLKDDVGPSGMLPGDPGTARDLLGTLAVPVRKLEQLPCRFPAHGSVSLLAGCIMAAEMALSRFAKQWNSLFCINR